MAVDNSKQKKYIYVEDFIPNEEERALQVGILKESLKLFIKVIHYFAFGSKYTFLPFHDEIIEKLEAIAKMESKKRNLLVNIPVGFGKSLLGEYFIAWTYFRNMNCSTVYTSYSESLVTSFSKEIKDIIESEIFQALQPYVLKKDTRGKNAWQIEGSKNRCKLSAGSMGGTMTGLDAGNQAIVEEDENSENFMQPIYSGALIIDDPTHADKSHYQNELDKTVRLYNGTLKSRLRTSWTPIILFMQRLKEGDLSGYILEKELDDWEVVTIKAMEDNKSVWEDKVSTKELLQKKKNEPDVFLSQYQQEPNDNLSSAFGNAIMAEESETHKILDGFSHIDAGYGGGDTTALTIMNSYGFHEDDDFVIYAFGKMFTDPITKVEGSIISYMEEYRTSLCFMETNGDKGFGGGSLKSEADKENFGLVVSDYFEDMNKQVKIRSYLTKYWDKIKWVQGTDPKYIQQIQRYRGLPNEKDDCPDSASSLIRELTRSRF